MHDLPVMSLGTAEQGLHDFVEEISSELRLNALLARIVECACRLVDVDLGALGLHDSRESTKPPLVLHRSLHFAGGDLLAERLASLVLERCAQPPSSTDGSAMALSLDGALIGMPIQAKGEACGYLGVAAPNRQLTDDALQRLACFARHAGIAIENAQRYERARRRTARFELVARVARIINAGADLKPMLQQTADAIHDVLEFPNVDIPLLDPNDPTVLVVEIRGGGYKRRIRGIDRIPISQGVMGTAVRERRTQRIDDVHRDHRYITPPTSHLAHAELAVPILASGTVLGVVNVEGEQAFDELDERTLEIIADHLSVAIQNARLHELNREAAVWQERVRLRRELHDSVTQILSSISLLSQALPSAWRRSPEEGERRAQRLAELAQTAFAEMRALLRELQPPEECAPHLSMKSRSFLGLERLRDGGLAAALPRLLDAMIPESMGRSYCFERYVPQLLAHEEALYRVCQEAASNVIRHARARQLTVTAYVDQTDAWLRVRDDGVGLASEVRGGIGLKSMRERITRLGGTLSLHPATPRGLEIHARLPRRDRELERPWTMNTSA